MTKHLKTSSNLLMVITDHYVSRLSMYFKMKLNFKSQFNHRVNVRKTFGTGLLVAMATLCSLAGPLGNQTSSHQWG